MTFNASRLQHICQVLAEAASTLDLDERELVTRFFEEGFFSIFDYGRVGEDVRLEQRTLRGRVDITLQAFGARPICILEFKRPGTPLSVWINQLEEYVNDVLPEWGILTNGTDLLLFQCQAGHLLQPPIEAMRLDSLTTTQARSLYEHLRRREVDLRSLGSVLSVLEDIQLHPLHVSEPQEPGGRQFITRFKLGRHTAFGRLVYGLNRALAMLLESSDFTRGAYEFWRRVYARELSSNEVPRSWRDLVARNHHDIYHLMFALETAYVLLARVMLIKAMQDTGFPGVNSVEAYSNGLRIAQRRDSLPPQAYIHATSDLFQYAGRQAFSSLFASDIFDWWQDGDSLPNPSELSDALAEATIAIFSFDFSRLRGDILGTLYQSYFDPETRKALGEFYTPPEVVDFILDNLEYQGPDITTKRLLDPACGSGTFLVHALTRYLTASQGKPPTTILGSLIGGLRIVGFDINPFATLMAQVNYAAHILPTYTDALRTDPDFELPGIPIFRTDSLRQETREGESDNVIGVGQQITYIMEAGGDIAHIRTKLPVLERENEFIEVLVAVPRFDRALEQGLLNNAEEYFTVIQVIFDISREGNIDEDRLKNLLQVRVGAYASELTRFVREAAKENANTVERLRREYSDGRFLKTLEDLALALVLKNDLRYDYVVGNPPYVRIQSIPEMFRRHWEKMYTWASGNFDIYIPFIQRAITQWLEEGGRLGFICSDRFLLVNYGEALREHLLEEGKVGLILDIRDSEVFQQALNYPAIFTVHRTLCDQPYSFLAGRAFADPVEGGIGTLLVEAKSLLREVSQSGEYKVGYYIDAFPQEADTLEPGAWSLMPPAERHVFKSLEEAATNRLEQLTVSEGAVFEGLSTGADSVMIFQLVEERPQTLLLNPRGAGRSGVPATVEIEKGILRQWSYGRDMQRWQIPWEGWFILWPYLENNGIWQLMPNSPSVEYFPYATPDNLLDNAFPLAWEYLTLPEVRRILTNREHGRFSTGKSEASKWYAFSAPRSLGLYSQTKICLQELTQNPNAAIDNSSTIFGPGICGIALQDTDLCPFIAALLNSSALFFWIKQRSVVHGGHSLKYDSRFSSRLPIRLPQNIREQDIKERLEELVTTLAHKRGELRQLDGDLSTFLLPQNRRLRVESEYYSLEDQAISTLHGQKIHINDFEISPEIDGCWRIVFGRNSITLPTEEHIRLLEAWVHLQKSQKVDVDHVRNLLLPNTAVGCHLMLDLLRSTQDDISQIIGRIGNCEDEIDELVADLYGIDQEGRQVIKDFLDRF